MRSPQHVFVVSSPGPGPGRHWSHDFAAALTALCRQRGAAVAWAPVLRRGQTLPPDLAASAAEVFVADVSAGAARVAADHRHLPIERVLTQALRNEPSTIVVHAGVGARGSPNLLWLAERLGSTAFAVARGAEIVCHRGDLVDRAGSPCGDFTTPERCQRCCRAVWRRPSADDFRTRADLLVASLLSSRSIVVPADADVELLMAMGVPRQSCVVCPGAEGVVGLLFDQHPVG
jgi:hypothetical protein